MPLKNQKQKASDLYVYISMISQLNYKGYKLHMDVHLLSVSRLYTEKVITFFFIDSHH